jgi:hypothetical protein
VHPVEEIAPHQAVAAAAVDVEAGAAGDQQAEPVAIGVEKSLQERLPSAGFVDLVEDGDGGAGVEPVETEAGGDGGGAGQDRPPVVVIVPVQLEGPVRPARGGLADLPGARHEGHLAVLLQVPPEDLIVQAFARRHGMAIMQDAI